MCIEASSRWAFELLYLCMVHSASTRLATRWILQPVLSPNPLGEKCTTWLHLYNLVSATRKPINSALPYHCSTYRSGFADQISLCSRDEENAFYKYCIGLRTQFPLFVLAPFASAPAAHAHVPAVIRCEGNQGVYIPRRYDVLELSAPYRRRSITWYVCAARRTRT